MRMMQRLFFLLLFVALPLYSVDDSNRFNETDLPLEIQRIVPSGRDVVPARQLVIQFNQPVVNIGRMERAAAALPITITPALACQWRWLNTSALACHLAEAHAMRPATQYELVIKPGIQTRAGKTLEFPFNHRFITERPKVTYTTFTTWLAPGVPVIRVHFNQPVSQQSLAQHVHFLSAASLPVSVRVQPPRITDSGLSVAADSAPDQPYRQVWEVLPVEPLAQDVRVELKIEPGIKSQQGQEPGDERRALVAFDTFPEFEFLGVECRSNAGDRLETSPTDALLQRCNPRQGISLRFSAPVISEVLKQHLTLVPDLSKGRKDYDPWENHGGYSYLSRAHEKGQAYRIYFPEYLDAWKTYALKIDSDLKDEFGRNLKKSVSMSFNTDHRLPALDMSHPFSVLESQQQTDTPVIVTNLDALEIQYQRIRAHDQGKSLNKTLKLPEVEDLGFRTPLKVRELLDGKSGAVYGRLQTQPKVDLWRDQFFSQVTPYQVHLKLGHFNSLIWVTDLATGKPVIDAKVEIYSGRYSSLASPAKIIETTATDRHGIARLSGTLTLSPDLKLVDSWNRDDPRLFVRITGDHDMALLPLDRHFEADTWQASRETVYPASQDRYGHIHSWGTTAQGVYRAGDTLQFKLYLRDQNNEGFVAAPKAHYHLEIVDPQGNIVHRIENIELNKFGSYAGEYTVPKAAAVGWYQFNLGSDFSDHRWSPMRVLISDFTPAAFRVTTELNGKVFHAADRLQIQTQAQLHAGGPYGHAGTRIRVRLQSQDVQSSDPALRGFEFNSGAAETPTIESLLSREARVDEKGALQTELRLPETRILYGRLTVESSVRDDRGKSVTGVATADYAGRDRYVGLRQADWLMTAGKPSQVDVVVIDEQGTIIENQPVHVVIERRETKAARVKGAGNAYLTQYHHEWLPAGDCEIKSAKKPLACQVRPEKAGYYRIIATTLDTQARKHQVEISTYAIGSDDVVWSAPEHHALPLIAEKNRYKVGETARYFVQNPFPGAEALVTIERYGVMKSWTQTLRGNAPVIEFNVEPEFQPGFYLSVVVMSPRVAQPLGEGEVDLGKPTFRMGYVETAVQDTVHQLDISAKVEKTDYKPGELVKVELAAKPRQPDVEAEPVELAVIALDQAVFDLIQGGSSYFDPYRGFYSLDGLDLRNFSLLTRLIGRQKIEKKGANTGGDGGGALKLRTIFKYVGYWNPSLVLQPGEHKTLSFNAPDNLTGWRILVLAVTPSHRMGLGEASFRVNRKTELRPVMPNQLTSGDQVKAGFSVMNRTDHPRTIKVNIRAEGALSQSEAISENVSLKPFERHTVYLPLTSQGEGEIHFTASAGDDIDRDGVEYQLPVQAARVSQTAARYGSTTAENVTEHIEVPDRLLTGRLDVQLAPSVMGNIDGAFSFMRDYPYNCWEQKLSKGTMAAHFQRLDDYLDDGFSWPGSTALPDDILKASANFQAANGGMSYFKPQARYVSPYLSAYTALAFNWLRQAGKDIPASVETKLDGYLEKLLRQEVQPDFYSQGMASTVRAVSLAALAKKGKVTPSDLERYQQQLPRMSLFGKAMFLQAALAVPGSDEMRAEVADNILSYANQSAGKFSFTEVLDDRFNRILASPLRTQCAILSALTAYGETAQGQQKIGDIPFKLVNFITQNRGQRDHWENTQENMFCLNALADFSEVYEVTKPDMDLKTRLSRAGVSTPLGAARFDSVKDKSVVFQKNVDTGRLAVNIQKTGQGRVYYSTRLNYTLQDKQQQRVNAGMDIRREYSIQHQDTWTLLDNPVTLKPGDLVRVDLYLSLAAARNFVVVDDPVPGGLEPVNRDLATTSAMVTDERKFIAATGSWYDQSSDWKPYDMSRWSFYHKELRFDSARFYADYLPAGNYHLSYIAQVIAPGTFSIQPVKAEEMYNPDVYGLGRPGELVVAY